ncbi:MAG: thermonuclease family protein [Candidatus Pelagibacterales bacterium]
MILLKKIFVSNYFIFLIGIFIGIYFAIAVLKYYTSTEVFRAPPTQGNYKTYSFMHDDLNRTYDVYIPSTIKKNASVFFLFHASRGNSKDMRSSTGYDFEYLAQEKGFLVVYPQGYKNHWNDCRATADYAANIQDIDDVGYFQQMVKSLEENYMINRKQLVVSGISNGGHMVFKLAHEIPKDILLYTSFAANLPVQDNNDCSLSQEEVNMIIFNGTNDPINPYDGGLVSILGNDSRGFVISAEETYNYWRDLTSYEEEKIMTIPQLDSDSKTFVIKKESIGSKYVALYSLVNGGHIYASPYLKSSRFAGESVRDINGAEEIYATYLELIDNKIVLRKYNNQYCYDGDTCYVMLNGANTKIRLLELDTPEISKPKCEAELELGLKARDYLNNLIDNAATIEFKTDYEEDYFGRTLSYLIIDGEDVSANIVSKNLGVVYDRDNKTDWCS